MEIVIIAVVTLVVVAATVFFGFRSVVGRVVTTRAWHALTDEEREQWHRKLDLLESRVIVEFFAPNEEFVKEWDAEKKKPRPAAWASPYRAAVLKLWAKRKNESPAKLALVRQQIAAAAESITIETLASAEQPANSGLDHFSIEVPLNGRPAAEVEGLAETIKSVLKLKRDSWSLRVATASTPGFVRFVCHEVAPTDRLVAQDNRESWFRKNPAKSPLVLPLGVDDSGQPVCISMHHTFIYGTTGAGKGSVLSGMMVQLAPFILRGLVEVYAIDPNGAELEKFKDSRLLKAYAVGQKDAEALVQLVQQKMALASESRVRNETNDYGAKFVLSKESPLVILFIDEANSFLGPLHLGRTTSLNRPDFRSVLQARMEDDEQEVFAGDA